ncbi:MAG: hypothetical protein ACJ74Y_05620, partial [Bryobacteraceae bacterium]
RTYPTRFVDGSEQVAFGYIGLCQSHMHAERYPVRCWCRPDVTAFPDRIGNWDSTLVHTLHPPIQQRDPDSVSRRRPLRTRGAAWPQAGN